MIFNGLSRFRKTAYIVIILISLVFSFYVAGPPGYRYNEDDLRNTLAPEIFLQYNGFYFKETLNDVVGVKAFVPPGFVVNKNGITSSSGFFGLPLLLTSFYAILSGPSAFIFFQMVIQSMIILVSYLIIRTFIFKGNILFYLIFLFSFSPFFISLHSVFYPENTSLLFQALSLYFILLLIKDVKKSSSKMLFILFYFIGLSLLIKLANFIFLAPIIFLFFFKKKIKLIYLTFFIVLVGLIMLPQYWFNYKTLGDPFQSYFTSYEDPYRDSRDNFSGEQSYYSTKKGLFLFRFFTEYILPQGGASFAQFSVYYPNLLFSSVFIIFFFFSFKHIALKSDFRLALFFVMLITLYFFSNMGGGFGFGSVNIRSSFMRYTYIVNYLVIIFGFLGYYKSYRYSMSASLLVLANFIFLISLYPINSYVFGNIKKEIIPAINYARNIPEGSIILSPGFNDGFLFQDGYRIKRYDYSAPLKFFTYTELKKVIDYFRKDDLNVYLYYINSNEARGGGSHLIDLKKLQIDNCIYLSPELSINKYSAMYKLTYLSCEKNDFK